MFRLNKGNKKLEPLNETTFSSISVRERDDIEEWIEKNPEMLGEQLFIIAKEYAGFDKTKERLDLLALDKSGNIVVIELKSDDSGRSVDWQAIKYASYCAQLLPDDIVEIYADYKNCAKEAASKEIVEFIGEATIPNEKQRIILLSKEFRAEVTCSVLWLIHNGINIKCVEIRPYLDESTNNVYINFNVLLPIPSTEQYMIRKARVEQVQQITREQIREYSAENILASGNGEVLQWYQLLRDKALELGPGIKENITSSYVAFRDKKNFAEISVNRGNLLIHIRPVSQELMDKHNCKKVPDSHGWTLNTKFSINSATDVVDRFELIEQSYLSQK